MMPANKIANRKPMAIKVLEAFRGGGSLKLGMVLDIASTPVNAELPDEKALNKMNKEIPVTEVPKGACKSGEI
ncbi:hypothetical protein D3C85_1127150 [compost metagenome]